MHTRKGGGGVGGAGPLNFKFVYRNLFYIYVAQKIFLYESVGVARSVSRAHWFFD